MTKSRRDTITEMLAQDPHDPFLRYALAMEYASAGDDAQAVAEFTRLLTEHPGYVAAYFQGGQALVRLGRDAEARDLLQRGITAARQAGDLHTAEEMAAFLASIG